jgi:hypothetical protein
LHPRKEGRKMAKMAKEKQPMEKEEDGMHACMHASAAGSAG